MSPVPSTTAFAGGQASRRRWRTHAVASALFVLATLGAAVAHQGERPVTAAIVYLFGVVLVGALGRHIKIPC